MGLKVKVASEEDLYAMKKAAGRPKDLDDVRFLETILRKKLSGG